MLMVEIENLTIHNIRMCVCVCPRVVVDVDVA